MEKIINYFRNYFAKSSWLKISTDFLFYLKPKVVTEENAIKIKPEEFQLILEDLKGNTVNLSDYKNRTIFVNFWATWCPPCRAEMPAMQKLFNRYGTRIPIFLITSEEKSIVENYLRENAYNLPVYFRGFRCSVFTNQFPDF
jgi:thiol-disulfide isomerase/thioredoxin